MISLRRKLFSPTRAHDAVYFFPNLSQSRTIISFVFSSMKESLFMSRLAVTHSKLKAFFANLVNHVKQGHKEQEFECSGN
jgi:hypothetical protein